MQYSIQRTRRLMSSAWRGDGDAASSLTAVLCQRHGPVNAAKEGGDGGTVPHLQQSRVAGETRRESRHHICHRWRKGYERYCAWNPPRSQPANSRPFPLYRSQLRTSSRVSSSFPSRPSRLPCPLQDDKVGLSRVLDKRERKTRNVSEREK